VATNRHLINCRGKTRPKISMPGARRANPPRGRCRRMAETKPAAPQTAARRRRRPDLNRSAWETPSVGALAQ
jgi:hypothetical protein